MQASDNDCVAAHMGTRPWTRAFGVSVVYTLLLSICFSLCLDDSFDSLLPGMVQSGSKNG